MFKTKLLMKLIAGLLMFATVNLNASTMRPAPGKVDHESATLVITNPAAQAQSKPNYFLRSLVATFVAGTIGILGTVGTPQVAIEESEAFLPSTSSLMNLAGKKGLDLMRGEVNRALSKNRTGENATEAVTMSCNNHYLNIPALSEGASFTPEESRRFQTLADIIIVCKRIDQFDRKQDLIAELKDKDVVLDYGAIEKEQLAEMESIFDAITMTMIRMDPATKHVENIRLARIKFETRARLRKEMGRVTMDNLDEYNDMFVPLDRRPDFSKPLPIAEDAQLFDNIEELLK